MIEKSFEKYLEDNINNKIIDFSLRASIGKDGIEFYIHPDGKDGETLDYWVESNTLISRSSYNDNNERIIKDIKVK